MSFYQIGIYAGNQFSRRNLKLRSKSPSKTKLFRDEHSMSTDKYSSIPRGSRSNRHEGGK